MIVSWALIAAITAAYLYVAAAAWRAERLAGASVLAAVPKALVWPWTIWHTVQKLYFATPPKTR